MMAMTTSRPPYLLRRTDPEPADLGIFDSLDYEPVYAARESVHKGGGEYTASSYTLTDASGREADAFRLDCDGQCVETD